MDDDLLVRILEESKRIIANMNQYKRERALEDYRKEHFPYLPSRLHSMWVSDENALSFWKTQFKNSQLVLYKVSLTGIIFKSSDQFIPDDELDVYQSYMAAENYWQPSFQREEEKSAEFLFQGKVMILEKVDI